MRNQGLCTRLGKSGDSVLRRYKAGTQYSVWRVISYYLTTTSADEVNLIREGRIEAECRSLLNFRTSTGSVSSNLTLRAIRGSVLSSVAK